MSWGKTCFIELTEVQIDDNGNYTFNPIMFNINQIEYIKPYDETDPMIGAWVTMHNEWTKVRQSYDEICDILSDSDLVFYFAHKEV
jgi:hypothetical protein